MSIKFGFAAVLATVGVVGFYVARKNLKKSLVQKQATDSASAASTSSTEKMTAKAKKEDRQVFVEKMPNGGTVTSFGPTEAEKEQDAKTVFDSRFVSLYNSAQKIEFDIKFNNGTDYLDGCWTSAVGKAIPEGISAFKTDNGRLAVVIKTEKGTAVLFQRYSNRKDYLAICSNYNKSKEDFFALAASLTAV